MLESALRKMVSIAVIFMGLGYILPSLATIVILNYFVSQYPIESLRNIYMISGIVLFILASVLLVAVGVIIVIGGLKYLAGKVSGGAMFLGILLSSFYLLCLAIGSSLIQGQLSLSLWIMIAGSILAMAGAAVYLAPPTRFKVAGSLIGIAGGVLLTIAIYNGEILDIVFDAQTSPWNVPFPGPFMSVAILEGFALIGVSVTALVNSVARNREKPVTYIFLSIVALIYGIGVFIGSLILSFSFLNLVQKAPWELALYGRPYWVVGTVIFWIASLGVLEIGGILLILSSCVGFAFAVKRFS